MAFTVADFEDLVRLLGEQPEWRARLRPLILGAEWEGVPSRLDRIEAVLERIADRQDGTEREIGALTQRMDALTERMDALTERVDALAQRVDALTEEVRQLVEVTKQLTIRMDRMDGRLGNLEGSALEQRYRNQCRSWFADWVRGAEVVSPVDLEAVAAAVEAGTITAAEARALRDLDLLVQGRDAAGGDGTLLLIAVELSHTINVEDIDRASERAMTLRRAGYAARALAGGYRVAPDAEKRAAADGVIIDLHRIPA